MFSSCCAQSSRNEPTFTRSPQILTKDAKSAEPIAILDVGFKSVCLPAVEWTSPKGDMITENDHIKVDLLGDGKNLFTAQLQIKNYLAKDNGTYRCIIKNKFGFIIAELTLEVEEYIKTEPEKTDDGMPGQQENVKSQQKGDVKRGETKTGETVG